MECDQPEAIAVKKHMVEKAGKYGHVTYASLDLNDDSWPDFEQFLTQARVKVFVLIEGVSPYVNEEAFRAFLELLGRRLAKGSRVAYDFKLRGVSDTFGLSGRTEKPFRLSGNRQELTEYHDRLGFTLCNLSYSTEILGSKVYAHPEAGTFKEDGLIQLEMT